LKLTLACKFEGSNALDRSVKRTSIKILVDTETPNVELRIAQSMGTANGSYFSYRNRQTKRMTEDKMLLNVVGSKMSMAAIRLGVPTSIVLDRLSGAMVWARAEENGGELQ